MTDPRSEGDVLLWKVVATNVTERLAEGDGIWRTCSGCYESEDGYPNGHYPHSEVFNCTLGGGCSECGGLGATWDTTDYGAMADALAQDTRTPSPPSPAVDESELLALAERLDEMPLDQVHDSWPMTVRFRLSETERAAIIAALRAATPVEQPTDELGSSERLGPHYDGTRSINSSSMVARHHDSDTLGDRATPVGGDREELLATFQRIQGNADNSGAVYTIASNMIDRLALFPLGAGVGRETKFSPGDAVEVRKQNDEIDEIVIRRGDVHIEQMSADGWFMGVEGNDGSYWQFWFGAKNKKSAVEFRHVETVSPAENIALSSKEANVGNLHGGDGSAVTSTDGGAAA